MLEIAARQQLEMSERQTPASNTAEEQYSRSTNEPSIVGEPQEVPEVAFNIGRQLRDPPEAPQTMPCIDVHPLHPPMRMAFKDDGATALRDWHTAKYEARLRNSQAQAPVAQILGRDLDLIATTGAGLLRGAGYGYFLHPDRLSRPTWLTADLVDSPWAHHQQRADGFTNNQPRSTSASQYGVHDWVAEPLGTGMARQPAPQPIPQGSMEMPDPPSEGKETDEGYAVIPSPTTGNKSTTHYVPHYVEPNHGGERLS